MIPLCTLKKKKKEAVPSPLPPFLFLPSTAFLCLPAPVPISSAAKGSKGQASIAPRPQDDARFLLMKQDWGDLHEFEIIGGQRAGEILANVTGTL